LNAESTQIAAKVSALRVSAANRMAHADRALIARLSGVSVIPAYASVYNRAAPMTPAAVATAVSTVDVSARILLAKMEEAERGIRTRV